MMSRGSRRIRQRCCSRSSSARMRPDVGCGARASRCTGTCRTWRRRFGTRRCAASERSRRSPRWSCIWPRDESRYTTGAAFVLDGGLLGDDSTPICARWTRTGPVTAGGPCRHNRAADGPGDGTVADSPPEHERHQTPEYEHDAPLQGRGQRDGVDDGGACDHPALNPLHQ